MRKTSADLEIAGGASLKAAVPKNTPAQFRFVNPDGGETTTTWQYGGDGNREAGRQGNREKRRAPSAGAHRCFNSIWIARVIFE